jgi:acyl homoserine lactone synthase
MLSYLYADELDQHPTLRDTMFRDRALQFKTRLNWDVTVDENGFERDEYDDLNPLYVIWQKSDGSHNASIRLLPTTGRCMVNEHFLHLNDGHSISSPLIWEATRFCQSPTATVRATSAMMLAAGEAMVGFGVEHCVAVFDARTFRAYRMLASEATILGAQGEGREQISVGIWSFDDAMREKVCNRAGVTPETSQSWFAQHFGAQNLASGLA